MDFETYARSKFADYAALAETVAAILRAAIVAYPETFRLQQVQHRLKDPESLRKKLEDRGILATTALEDQIKDLAGCRLIFYTNSDVARFLQSGIIQDNFDVDWDRTKIHHPVPGQTEPDTLFISNNYVVKLKADRTALPEYARFGDLWCEVQVQTTLNHAWSEMEHDIIYKKPVLRGFGGKLLEAIEQRLQKIMKAHLLPAGYEFQKVLDDYERLLSGKELFDRGALKALAECNDNNARYELLERFRDYVLPNYDDPTSVYPEIRERLVAAVKAARLTKPRPFETPFGTYREQRIGEFVGEVNERNAEEWFAIIQRCAQTESDDLMMFPSFGQFLQKLSQAKPQVVLGFIDRLDERLTGFLGVMLSGLAQSDRRADFDAKIGKWLAQEKHLAEMAHYVQLASEFDPALLRKILALGIKRKEDPVLVQVMAAFGRRYGDAPEGLIEAIFLPAIEYFTGRRDARWVNLLWFLPQERSPLCALTAEQTDVVLRSLVHLRRIESHAERVLGLMAKSQPEKVFNFFGERLAYAALQKDEDSYEAIPFQFHGLEKTFANIANHAAGTVRQWFVSGDAMFQFRGGRFLANSFPNFPEVFSRKLLSYVRNGNRDDIEFVICVMPSYHGEAFLNETCKAVVRALPVGDPLLPNVEIILQSTGVVAGEFGFVEAYTKKKQEMAAWLTDQDAHVRAFAESYIRLLDRQIAAEQRRSEENLEMRKRMYDDPRGIGESQT
ncbi:MAG TPA: RelA/SpoT domain-containing protein [Xanthobacteraceae bacterium]